jgi:hypothetical protein
MENHMAALWAIIHQKNLNSTENGLLFVIKFQELFNVKMQQ